MFSARDEFWMQQALALAAKAEAQGEVPVGAVLVLNDEIIGTGFNSPITACDPTAHAEVMALRLGAEKIGNYRLLNSTLYATLEPCLMCAGALVHARIKRLVYGARDPRAGAVTSVFQALDNASLNHRVEYQDGLLQERCGAMLSEFFQKKRKG
jgi:tRNA(adenine34) deaminase